MRKRRRQNRRSNHSASGGWKWLLAGVVLGGILGSVGYFHWLRPSQLAKVPQSARRAVKAIPKPQYDFYTLLPDAESEPVRAPRPSKPVAKAPTPAPAPTPKPGTKPVAPIASPANALNYRLQLGVFEGYPQADALKAKLAFQGIMAEIAAIKTAQGQARYRVQTPPLNSKEQALVLKNRLAAQSIPSLLLATE